MVHDSTIKDIVNMQNYHHMIKTVRANSVPTFLSWTTIPHTQLIIGK